MEFNHRDNKSVNQMTSNFSTSQKNSLSFPRKRCYKLQLSVQLRSDIIEDVFSARNCESAHGMLISEFLFSHTKQRSSKSLLALNKTSQSKGHVDLPLCAFVKKNSLASDPASQLNILRHDGNPLSVNGAQIGVFEETHQVSLRSLLKSRNGARLESKIGLEVLSDFPHQSLERKLSDQKLSALLVLSDLPKGNSSGPETMWLLHSSGGGSRLPCCLGRQLLPWSLSSGGLSCCLLDHCVGLHRNRLIPYKLVSELDGVSLTRIPTKVEIVRLMVGYSVKFDT
ncbi:hypothetical protein F8388_011933 [Cannabis sativa]|uniref:Uncharacterized protein n=1 Tax=Cannabis sativa TaxID=3483 RepID=A0A7J6GDL0_CANSA|nr:hypothetical protein F8388_011933 [Cannabis sativa]